MEELLRILVIDDSKVFWMYLRKALEESGIKANIKGALDMASGISMIKCETFDCVFLDYMLPDGNGLLVLQEIRASGIKTPVIVLTGQGDEQVAVKMMKAGANDYIPKSQISSDRLGQSIRSVIHSHILEEYIEQVEKELQESKEFFESIVKNAKALIVGVDVKSKILLFNHHCEKVTGWKREEAIGKEWLVDFIPTSFRPQVENIFKRLIEQNEGIEHESPILTISGEECIIDWNYSTLQDSFGNVSLVLGIGVDVTDRKLAEESLRRRLAYEKLIAEVSYLAASAEDINDFIHDSLQKIGHTLDANRILIIEYSSDTDTYSNSYEWTSAGAPPQHIRFQEIPSDTVSWFDAAMKKNMIINYSDIENIPSAQERELLNLLGVKSILAIPLYVNKAYHGFLNFCQTEKNRVWPDEDIDILKTIIQIIAGTIERKGTENALRLSEDKYRSIFEGSKDTVFITSKDGYIIDANPTGVKLFGFSLDELKSMKATDLYEEPSNRSEFVKEMERKGFVKDYPIILKKKNGQKVYGLLTATFKKNMTGQAQFQGVIRDITESKRAEEALREAHAQIKQLLASISSILIGVSSNDLVNQWNVAAEKSFGISASEVLGKPFFQCGIQWDWNEVVKHVSRCKEKNLPVQLDDMRYTRPEGKDGLLSLYINRIEDAAGCQWGYVLLGTDITEQKRNEAQLALSQKMESIGQLAAGIAHEINTPMQYIGDNTRFFKDSFHDLINILEKYKDILIKVEGGTVPVDLIPELKVLEKDLDLDYLMAEIPRAIEQSLDGINRVRKLILAMKDFSHPGRTEKALSDINKAIDGTVTISKNEWKYVAELETILDPNLPLVYCALDQINQVILNMIVNASQAIKENAEAGFIEKGKIKIETRHTGPTAQIIISDTGKGIPQSIIYKIFDPFFTTKEVGKGTGQGLTLAHDIIVNKHKGSIDVYSEPGKGTTFVIQLPVDTTEVKSGVES